MNDDWVVGVDLGSNKIEIGVSSPDNRMPRRFRIPTLPSLGPQNGAAHRGGLSPNSGQDVKGPSVLNSVSKVNVDLASNGTLLDMEFLPAFFEGKRADELRVASAQVQQPARTGTFLIDRQFGRSNNAVLFRYRPD